MRWFLMSAAVVALGLAVAAAGAAGAAGGRGGHGSDGHGRGQGTGHGSHASDSSGSRHGGHKDYHKTYGTKFKHGYYYKGKHHNHWSYRCWDKRYGCYLHYCRFTFCWYYWCPPDDCYYPVSYCPYDCYCF